MKKPPFKKFTKNKKQKQILIGLIIAVVIVVGGISLIASFAMYQEKHTFDVLKGLVPDFSSGDITLAYTIDGQPGTESFPTKESGLYGTKAECQNGATADWSNKYWGLFNVNSNNNKKIVCNITFETKVLFHNYIINQALEDEKLVKVIHETTDQTEDNATTDYRYTGSDPDNYVCFGSELEECPDDNLYRIIGVMPTQTEENGTYENRVKLIKNNYYTESTSGLLQGGSYAPNGVGYRWNANYTNVWETSGLNTNVLNKVYWNSLTEKYQAYIEKALWYLGAPQYSAQNTYKPEDFYKLERSNFKGVSQGNLYDVEYIGLMYPSDYGFSIDKDEWEKTIYDNASTYAEYAWLNKKTGKYEWTISPERSYGGRGAGAASFALGPNNVSAFSINHPDYINGIRPTFYLKQEVQYKSGDGSITNPYRISIAE